MEKGEAGEEEEEGGWEVGELGGVEDDVKAHRVELKRGG